MSKILLRDSGKTSEGQYRIAEGGMWTEGVCLLQDNADPRVAHFTTEFPKQIWLGHFYPISR